MAQPVGRQPTATVLVVASGARVRELRALLADLRLVRVEPMDGVTRALATRPRLFVWLDGHPDAGLRSIGAIRDLRSGARAIFVTPRSAETERLAALESGVEDVIAGPVSPRELAARIRVQLRRAHVGTSARLAIAERLELDLDRQELLREGVWVHLRPKEARLLEFFARTPGTVLSRDHILQRVWGKHHAGGPRTVDVHVRWLRAKIEPDPHRPVWLRTIRGVGYLLEPSARAER